MTAPDSRETPQLTRRQLREIRDTASIAVINGDQSEADAAAVVAAAVAAATTAPAPSVDLSQIDLTPRSAENTLTGSTTLTRRQARDEEKLRTGAVAVVATEEPIVEDEPAVDDQPVVDDAVVDDEPVVDDVVAVDTPAEEPTDDESEGPQVAEGFGSQLLAGSAPVPAGVASFDDLLDRDTVSSGSATGTSALILTQVPSTTGSLVAPVAATGEVLITDSLALPDSFGSTGVAPGMTDGKDIDSALVDNELPATSSPTPIAASAAISTIKSSEDIIRPPAPEKNSKLMLALVVTAGVLALALTGVLILGFWTGVFR